MAQTPYEIIAAPFTVWLAAVGTAFPEVGSLPSASWTKIGGANGDQRYHEDGVSISHPQTVEMIRTLGSTGPVKAFRTEEDLFISFKVLNLTLEQYKFILNGNAVTDTAAGSGTKGYRTLPMLRGGDVTQYAMLVRGPSAYDANMHLDYRVPTVVHVGEPEVVHQKGEPAGLDFEMQAIENNDYAGGKFGEMVMQDAAAT